MCEVVNKISILPVHKFVPSVILATCIDRSRCKKEQVIRTIKTASAKVVRTKANKNARWRLKSTTVGTVPGIDVVQQVVSQSHGVYNKNNQIQQHFTIIINHLHSWILHNKMNGGNYY